MTETTPVPTTLGVLAGEVFDAVIFDMDGTLVDSTPAVARSWHRWGSEHGLTPEQLQGHHGVPAESIVRLLLPEARHAGGIARIHELELSDVDDIVVLPGAAEALAALVTAKNAIATSCTRPLAQARITAAGLVAPSVIVTVDDVERGKPHPDPFLEAARRLSVDPARCLVVEDAPKGLQAGTAAGCYTLAVVTTTPRDELVADAVVDDLAAVVFAVTDRGITIRPV